MAAPRITLVHDWLTGMRGGEKCLLTAARLWPHASLRTLLHVKGSVAPDIERLDLRASVLNRLPGVQRYYRFLLPLMPAAVRTMSMPTADVVLSFSHCVAKGVRPTRTPDGGVAPHVCYCFTPMRYAWQLRGSYFGGRVRGLTAKALDAVLDRLREWDRATAANVSHFVAISETIRSRIRECYGRDSEVIYPPVDTDFYTPDDKPREDFYLVVSALAPYKRIDLAMDACAKMGRKLVVVGSGQDAKRLAAKATPDVRLLGWQSDEAIRDLMRRCRALLFPGEEDFGIVPVEANACGTPVVGLGVAGLSETITPVGGRAEPTGVWFAEQTVESLCDGIAAFERSGGDIDPAACRRRSLGFSEPRYASQLAAMVDKVTRQKPARSAA